jgi:arylsulfatase A-like enzyme
MLTLFAVAAVAGGPGIGRAADGDRDVGDARAADGRPNVLIIVTDDQRATDTLQVMPNTLHYFRETGTRYTNAFAATPLCCPSRATLLTGRYAHNTGVKNNSGGANLDPAALFPRLLKESGYQTALAGKFLNGWPRNEPPPYFDRYAMLLADRASDEYWDPVFDRNGSVGAVPGYSTDLIRTYAMRSLRRFERADETPWFLYVAPHAPHHPWKAAPRHRDAPVGLWRGNPAVFERDRSDKPPFVQAFRFTIREGRAVRKGQLRTLMSVDEMVGKIFTTLRGLGESRDTLAIYTSDNGFIWADHGIGGARGTAGQKRLPYTASVKVPFLLRWPKQVAPGVVRRRLTGIVDIAPTVLDAVGHQGDSTGPSMDGRSLLQPDTRARVLLEYWREGDKRFPTWASIRTRTLQYVEYYDEDGLTPIFREFYDLGSDPWELNNLLSDGDPGNDPNVGALAAQLSEDRRCAGTDGGLPCP